VTAPDWLDELALEPGPPWLAMGTRTLDPAALFVVDEDRERDLAWKAELLAERHAEVFGALESPTVRAASTEVLDLVVAATACDRDTSLHPLDAAGRLVQEDLCLLVERDGAPHLDAASLCFPSYWRLVDKLGQPLALVHGPVAHYADELAAKVDRFIARLRPGRPVWRRNWSIHDDPSYFLPGPSDDDQGSDRLPATPTAPIHVADLGGIDHPSATPPAPNVAGGRGSGHQAPPGDARRPEAPEELWLRSERQTLTRLTTPGTVLFTIRTQQVPLAVLAERPDLARRMAAAIDAWSRELAAYKGGHGALAAAAWLRHR